MKTIPNSRRLLANAAIAAFAALAFAPIPHTSAQQPAPVTAADAKEFDAADALFQEGKVKEAMAAFERFREKYKGLSPKSLDATFRLALCYLRVEPPLYDDAVRELRGLIENKRVAEAVKEMAQLNIAKAKTMKAIKLPSETDAQKAPYFKAIDDAVKEYDAMLTSYPKSKDADSALFLSGQLLVAMENYAEAAKRFGSLVERFKQSPFAWDSQLWIGKAWFSAGNQKLSPKEKGKPREPKPDEIQEAKKFFDLAQPALAQVFSQSGDVALANEAVLYIAQMQLSRANLVAVSGDDDPKKKERDTLLNAALDAFRAVRSVEEVVAEQEAKIKRIEDAKRLIPAATPNYTATLSRIDNIIDNEEKKVANFKTGQDMYLSARISIAKIFLFLKKPDEARTLLRFLSGQKDVWDAEKEKDKTAAKETEASVTALLCLTYAESMNAAKALETYEEFRKNFKGNPAGENLPLMVANVVVETDADKAEEIVKQGFEDYPDWRFAADATRVLIAVALKRRDFKKAAALADEVLAGNPKPEVELQTLSMKGTILQAQARETLDPALADKAIEAFKIVITKEPDGATAEEAKFAICEIQAAKSPAKAVEPLNAFISSFSSGGKSPATAKNVTVAQYRLAQVLDGLGEKEKAIAEYRKLIEKWPESEPAQGAYFKVFEISAAQKNYPAALKVMREFREKYPSHENVYYTFNNEAEIVYAGNQDAKPGDGKAAAPKTDGLANTENGMRVLLDFVDYELAKDMRPRRGEGSLIKIADKWIELLNKLPSYVTLTDPQKVVWKKCVDGVIAAVEKQLQTYPDGERMGEALERLVFIEEVRAKAQQTKAADVEDYFKGLGTKYGKTAELKSKIEFALAAFLADKDPEAAFATRERAFKQVPEPVKREVNGKTEVVVTFTPNDYDGLLSGLFDKKRHDDIAKIVGRIRLEYPFVEGRPSPIVDNAQSVALFWEAKVLGEQGKTTDAGQKFAELRAKFPKSTKVFEADYGEILGKFELTKKVEDDYISRLTRVANSVRNVKEFELPAKALFLIARLQEASGDYDNAIDTYIKIHARYASVPRIAGDGLWAGAQLLERQAKGEIKVMTAREKKAAMAEVARKAKLAEEKKAAENKKEAEAKKKPGENKPDDKTPDTTKPEDARPPEAATAGAGEEKK